jgi:hypothetical protein
VLRVLEDPDDGEPDRTGLTHLIVDLPVST